MIADLNPASSPVENASPGTVPNAIEVDHIIKKYGAFTAVDDVSFNVKEEEIFGLLGPNGAGKSTLIRMMTTLIPITGGAAPIAGHDVAKHPDAARRIIGVIPQALTSDIDLTVEENMSIYAKLYDVPAKRRKAQSSRTAGTGRSQQMARSADQDTLWRNAAATRNCPRPGAQSPHFLSRRTDYRSRSRLARCGLGDAHQHQEHPPAHHPDHDALHGRSRPPVRSHSHRRSWKTSRARHAPCAEGQRAGSNVIEAQFENAPSDWEAAAQLPDVTSVQHEGAGMYRILPETARAPPHNWWKWRCRPNAAVKSLSVQNTTLDDVFVHYTGRQLRDELVKAHAFVMPPRPGMQP